MRIPLAIAASALLFCSFVQDAGAIDCSAYPSRGCSTQQYLDSIRSQLGSSLADAVAVQQELTYSLSDNRNEQSTLRDQVTASEARLSDLDAELARLQGEVDATTTRIGVERAELSALARAVLAEPSSFLLLAARAKDLGEIFTRTADLMAAGERGRALKASLESDLATLQTDLDKQQQARDAEAATRQDLVDKQTRLGQLASRGDLVAQQLEIAIGRVQSELSALRGQTPAIADRIRADLVQATDIAVAAAQGDVWAQAMIWHQLNLPAPAPHPVSAVAAEFRLAWPVSHPYITQGLGPSALLIEPPYGGYLHFHTGIDLADSPGTPIYTAHAGVVGVVGTNAIGYGNYVIVVHEQGYATLYGHLQRALVRVGDVVAEGRQIGLMGSSGWATGPHLHFELRLNGVPKDPSLRLPSVPGLGT